MRHTRLTTALRRWQRAAVPSRVILLDIALPKLNGYEAARKSANNVGKNIVMVELTGWGQDEDRQKSKEAGFNGHLVKPVVELTSLMKLLTGSSQQREMTAESVTWPKPILKPGYLRWLQMPRFERSSRNLFPTLTGFLSSSPFGSRIAPDSDRDSGHVCVRVTSFAAPFLIPLRSSLRARGSRATRR